MKELYCSWCGGVCYFNPDTNTYVCSTCGRSIDFN